MSKAAYASIAGVIAGNDTRQFNVTGTFIRCFAASHTDFLIRIDDDPVQFFDQGVGIELAEGERFTKIEVVNKSPTDLSIELGYGAGQVSDNRLSLVGGALPVEQRVLAAAEASETIAATSDGTIIAADPERYRGHLTNHGAGAVHVRATAGGTVGRPVLPGETFEFRTQSALYVHNPNGTSCVVTLLTERFS
jgi:hypothetical protein